MPYAAPCLASSLAVDALSCELSSACGSERKRRDAHRFGVAHGARACWAAMEAEDALDQRFYNSLLIELSDVYVSTFAVPCGPGSVGLGVGEGLLP